jgi:hypothetical protein
MQATALAIETVFTGVFKRSLEEVDVKQQLASN